MSHWISDSIKQEILEALKQVDRALVHGELFHRPFVGDANLIRRSAEALELSVLDYLLSGVKEDETRLSELRLHASRAFRLYQILPSQRDIIPDAAFKLRFCLLAVLGDRGADAARFLNNYDWSALPLQSDNWKERTWCTIIDIWLRLIRKKGWDDRDTVLERIALLRTSQHQHEREFLDSQPKLQSKTEALELICLYHLAKAAEILALYITDGVVEGNYQVQQLLDTHFDRVFLACQETPMINLEPLTHLLAAAAAQMAENSIWTVTRAVNSRVTEFVKYLVDRGRGDKALFDVLPPQRRTLAEKGLLGSSRRAVVVSLPTSSGKTLIAQFRILQALNQFEHEKGWVAYLAPTRTLVNQVTRQLRRDFAPLQLNVEQVSPALEVDGIEADLLQEDSQGFRILVTTPEKLDLLLRQGWEAKIGRPLTLVVVDEAHNIQNETRGLKLELLLSTINNECQRAQFLLLTPFIENAAEVARWLGGPSSEDVSLSIDWQPNDRVVGIVQAEKGKVISGKSFDYELKLKTVHSNRTIGGKEQLQLEKNATIASTFKSASDQSALAALASQRLQERGPVIVMHTRPSWVWSLANRLKIDENRLPKISNNIRLVQEFLELEYGKSFPLIELLEHGIGVHHAGLSDEVRLLMEWLFEENELRFLTATTTIAQGVNFPATGVVMASHQYPYGKDMPPEDFWNIAGRTGRIGQGKLGFVMLTAKDPKRVNELTRFINTRSGHLNSALIAMAKDARNSLNNLEGILYEYPDWSGFLQYLAHTYRQLGKPEDFISRIEQILRGTFGFGRLRSQEPQLANSLMQGIFEYAKYLQKPNQPLKLVDSTGFSLNSINRVLASADSADITKNSWNEHFLFSQGDLTLKEMMGILLKVPEIRKPLRDVTGGEIPDGSKLSLILKDWVNGSPVPEIAKKHFKRPNEDPTNYITRCGQALYGRLTQTASWGLGALLSITGRELDEEEFKNLSNLPSRVYYGVNDDSAMALRLLGVPRIASQPLAKYMQEYIDESIPQIRNRLRKLSSNDWETAIGVQQGKVYRKIWRILEGLD